MTNAAVMPGECVANDANDAKRAEPFGPARFASFADCGETHFLTSLRTALCEQNVRSV